MSQKLNEKALDLIIEEMIGVVENSKDEIFVIGEEARKEHEQLLLELQDTKKKVIQHINEGDRLEQVVKLSRKRLAAVSQSVGRFEEEEVREAYEHTHKKQAKFTMLRQEEDLLRKRRDDLERRLLSLSSTIDRAENLANKISSVLTYLNTDFKQITELVEEAKVKQEFGLKVIQGQEEERKRISREIHDGPAQMLANILLRSDIVDRAFRERSTAEALEEIKSIRKMIRTSLYEVRRIIYDLRPMALDDLGLIPTIKKYVHTVSEYYSMDIEFSFFGTDRRLPQAYEVALFRLMQEAIQNAVKHADASFIQVKLEAARDSLTMIIRDNGKGFNPEQKHEQSFGLIGMKERIELLEGDLSIDSVKGKGTRVLINVPLQTSRADNREKS